VVASPKPMQTILYIEDDPASRTLVERTLKHAGYTVLVAERGLEGIDIARRAQPDLVLTDINLPDISGREVTTMLRSDARFQNTPIVALTAQALHEQRELTMASGITGYLTKPIDVEALPDQVEHYLKGARDEIDAEKLSSAQFRYAQEVVTRLEARIRELESTNESLRRLDKMKDSFIQLTAHELRTPLTLVYGYSRLLEDYPALKSTMDKDENLKMLIKGMVDSTQRMQGIINEILTISRIMTNQIDMSIGPVDPVQVVQRVIAHYKNAVETRRLNVHFEPTNWPRKMRGDAELLTLAFNSLMSNAIKYTPDNGHITISATADDENIRVIFKDTGIGVAKDEQLRIFERFHTAGDTMLHSTSKTAFRGGGLGLGLAVCKGIIDAHGGRVWVESTGMDIERLPGSEFIVLLPLVAHKRV
jgi:signal transduction histidine kinase